MTALHFIGFRQVWTRAALLGRTVTTGHVLTATMKPVLVTLRLGQTSHSLKRRHALLTDRVTYLLHIFAHSLFLPVAKFNH